MTQAQTKSRHKLYAFRIVRVYSEFEDGRMNHKMCFLKINRFLELRSLISNLFHSMIVDEKKEFLKKLCFVLKKRVS